MYKHHLWQFDVLLSQQNKMRFEQFVQQMQIVENDWDKGKAFFQVGTLTQLLITGDLAYANIIQKPGVEEMGHLIAVVSERAVSGLEQLGLLYGQKKYTPEQVISVFTDLYNQLQEAITEGEWQNMSMDPIVLEHSLCKLKHARAVL